MALIINFVEIEDSSGSPVEVRHEAATHLIRVEFALPTARQGNKGNRLTSQLVLALG
jgi:hypothetical protein